MLSLISDLAREAAELGLRMRPSIHQTSKPDGTWVTEADKALETLIRRRLDDAFPGAVVFGEEHGGEGDLCSGERWVVDPIDGTTNFVTGLPTWGVSIGLLRDGLPVLGVFYMPEVNALYLAAEGLGCTLNGARTGPDTRGYVDHNSLLALNSEAVACYEVDTPAKSRGFGSIAAHACYVASGGLTAMLGCLWHTWDLAASWCIAAEVGVGIYALDFDAGTGAASGRALTRFQDLGDVDSPPPVLIGPDWAAEALIPRMALRARNPRA
jgi:myo-inositol-1(or 4)-monophosphatase